MASGESVVGALRVVLGLDTAKFFEDLGKSQSALGQFAKATGAVALGTELAKVIDEIGAKFRELTIGVIESADQIGKASEKYGIAVETLSTLKYAAQQADVPFDTLQKGFKALAQSAQEAANGTGPAAQAFQILGVNVRDAGGKVKDTYTLFLQTADGIAKFGDGLGKTSLAAATFGKRVGPDIIPLLNQGAAGIQNLTDRAAELGLKLTKETTDAAQEFNDRMKDMNAVATGVATVFIASFLPAMAKATDSLIEWAIHSKLAQTAGEDLARSVLFIRDNINVVVGAFEIFIGIKIIDAIVGIGTAVVTLTRAFASLAAIKALINSLSLVTVARFAAIAAVVLAVTGAIPAFNEALKSVGETLAKIMPAEVGNVSELLSKLGLETKSLTEDFEKLKKTSSEPFGPPIPPGFKPQAPVIDPRQSELAKRFTETLHDLNIQALDVVGGFNQLPQGFAAAAKGFQDLSGFGKDFGATLDQLSPKQRQLADALLNVQGARLTAEFFSPWTQYEQQLTRINVLLENHKISAETAQMASEKAAAAMAASYGQAAETITGPVAQTFATLAQMNSQYAGIAKAAAIANATVSTYVAAAKAYEALALFGPIVAAAGAAAAVAAGLANVAKIASVNTNFATGGSFKVAGGATGVDSQLVAFNATPGEMVDIRRPGAQSGGSVQTIELKAPRTRDFFSQNVRDLVDVLNAAAPDGYRLKMS